MIPARNNSTFPSLYILSRSYSIRANWKHGIGRLLSNLCTRPLINRELGSIPQIALLFLSYLLVETFSSLETAGQIARATTLGSLESIVGPLPLSINRLYGPLMASVGGIGSTCYSLASHYYTFIINMVSLESYTILYRCTAERLAIRCVRRSIYGSVEELPTLQISKAAEHLPKGYSLVS